MRLLSMTATFGSLENATLTLHPGLNVIEAPNEWGKSTWCAFLLAMLYGIDTRARSKSDTLADKTRYLPWSGTPMAGRMELLWEGRRITLERWTHGRTVFGEFRAYETESGLPVPELTKENCGKALLGVEREVFQRAGFLRFSDLPVTMDDALRRRLNALVTTGDENAAMDHLGKTLRDLKNKCRFNRSGLLPKAEQQRAEVESELANIASLAQQRAAILQREEALAAQAGELENHRDALRYAASQAHARRVQEAADAEVRAAEALRAQKQVCAGLPTRAEAEDTLQAVSALARRQDALQARSLPTPPQPPASEIPSGVRTEQAASDAARYTALQDQKRRPTALLLAVLSMLLAAAGGITFPRSTVSGAVLLALCAAFAVLALLVHLRARREIAAQAAEKAALLQKYAPLPPESWVTSATEQAEAEAQYRASMQAYAAAQAALSQERAALDADIRALCPAGSPAAQAEICRQTLHAWDMLEMRAHAHADAARHAHDLAALYQPAPPPALPDSRTETEAQTAQMLADTAAERTQLQLRLGQLQGQAEHLGSEQALRQELADVNARIAALEQTSDALTLAMQTLEQATQLLQRRFAPQITRRTQELFSALTGGRYDRLTLTQELAMDTGAVGEPALHSILWRSSGTADQLYFALRLAVAEALTPDAPLILDDALVRFDDTRLAAAMALLQDEAQQKQILLFTCQSRERAAAKM